MHNLSLSAAIYGILFVGLAAATGGEISLSNFAPRISDLRTQCKSVYNTKIDACVPSDFTPGAICSSGCLEGLAKIGAAVKTGCDDVDVGETSIIGVFQNDLGISALCPNNKAKISSSSSSTAQTTLRTSTQTSTPLATTTAALATTTVQPPSTSSSGLNIDSDVSTATFATSTVTTDPTGVVPTLVTDPSNAPDGNNQLSNSDSGGGSPFDVVAVGAAPQLQITKVALLTLLATIVLVAYG